MNGNVNVKMVISLFYDGHNGIAIVDVTIMAITPHQPTKSSQFCQEPGGGGEQWIKIYVDLFC
jgi:hypothetical protein